MNERRDYSLSKTDVITYHKSKIPRQMQFMILRGPGLNVQDAISENAEIKKIALKRRYKFKFMQANSAEDVIKYLKDANTWATGVVYNLGDIIDENKLIQKTLDKLLIRTVEIKLGGKVESVLEGLEQLSKN